ncbi:MAG: SidA/IucD/PvdA family monooxygenase [Bermanella sp.]
MSQKVYDFIAIGLGPFNLSLACLSDNIEQLNGIVLEQKPEFNWHPGMMLESAHLQTPFMSDLVTLADPSHKLSFLNYIKQQGRLYSFYIRENFYLMRSEYNQYCQWASQQVSNIRFNQAVTRVEYNASEKHYEITCRHSQSKEQKIYLTRKIILGTGPAPYIPPCCEGLSDSLIHSSHYLPNKQGLQRQDSITIVGGGQSAAEIYYDLLQEIDVYGYELNWVTRSPRFFPLEYSKLTLEMTSPEYVDYFYALPEARKQTLIASQKNLYKGINSSLINEIYDLLYVKRLSADFTTNILSNSTLKNVELETNGQRLKLSFLQEEQQQEYTLNTASVVLATGYQASLPDFLAPITQRIQWNQQGQFDVKRNYSIDKQGEEIFIQNAELHTHGFVSPDLGMACYRNSCIIRDLLGYEFYPIEKRIAFQQFSTPKNQQAGQFKQTGKVKSSASLAAEFDA